MSKFAKTEKTDEKEKPSISFKAPKGTLQKDEKPKAAAKEAPKKVAPAANAKGAKPAKKEAAAKSEDNRKIKVLAKENPKREGSESHKRFALYSKHSTVASFLAAGGTSADLRYDEKAGHIEVG